MLEPNFWFDYHKVEEKSFVVARELGSNFACSREERDEGRHVNISHCVGTIDLNWKEKEKK
jgi:hypothetical protein